MRDWLCKYKVIPGAHSRKFCCRGKQEVLNIIVVIFIQHKMHMCHILLSFVVSPAVPYSSTLSHKQHNLWGKKSS
jgi:hypothetical protein